jgi:uncharacterized membrane protein YciS (DUF1049 family)
MILLTAISTTIEKAEVIDFYKTLLVNQSSNYSSLITFFMGITALLISASIFGNFYIAKNQIIKEVEKKVKGIAKELDMKYIQLFEEAVKRIELSYEIRFVQNEAIQISIIANQCISTDNYTKAIECYAMNLTKYIYLKEDESIGNCIELLRDILTNSTVLQMIKPENLKLDEIIMKVNLTPDTLKKDKKIIIDAINLLKAKIEN